MIFFEEEKRTASITDSLQKYYVDVTLSFDRKITLNHNLMLENCNIVIDLSSTHIQAKKQRLLFYECKILLRGISSAPVFDMKSCNIEFENCEFAQENSADNCFPTLIQSTGDGRIMFNECSFFDIQGRIVQTEGTSVYAENMNITNLKGEFCRVTSNGDDLFPGDSLLPTLYIGHSNFVNCCIPSNAQHDNTFLICAMALNDIEIDHVNFENCNMPCIHTEAAQEFPMNFSSPCRIHDCDFKQCHLDAGFSYNCSHKYPYIVHLDRGHLTLEQCTFQDTDGLYMYCYSPTTISNCTFKQCGSMAELFNDGILYIFHDAGDSIIKIENCIFEECKINGKYNDDEDNGIIMIRAGLPSKKQSGTVHIKKCSFKKCKGAININGKEKQDGFFGSTITFYKIV